MKNKAILVSFIALFAIVFTMNAVMAIDSTDISINEVEVNGVNLVGGVTSVGHVSETVPVEIQFTANQDVDEEVKVKVYMQGFKSEITDSVILRTSLKEDVTYTEKFSLKLPSSMDLDEISEPIKIWIEFIADHDSFREFYTITMQKDFQSLNILSIDTPAEIIAGSSVPFDIVVENNGNERLDNVYVKVSIPDLGVERKVYLRDIGSEDESEDNYHDDIPDSKSQRIYLNIPRNAIPGIYNVEIEAYNYDTSVIATEKVIVSGASTGIIPSVTSRAIAVGEETTFDVILVNPNDRMVVYSITPEESAGLIIDVEEPIITVGADSSKTVRIRVKATGSAEEGTHLVTVNVNSESGLVKQVNFSLNVEEGTGITGKPNSVLILTVILAIIFVVLLIVLIVLLTKKPVEAEEFGETSYY